MNRIIVVALLLVCCAQMAHTQETIAAWNTPNGIFVNWPAAPAASETWVLERSDGWSFQKVADVESPKSAKDLRKREQEAAADFKHQQALKEALLDTFWLKSRQKPVEFDGERFPALQIAFGNGRHDKLTRNGATYRYRLVGNNGQIVAQSKPIVREQVRLNDQARLLRHTSKGNMVDLRWCVLPANPRLAWFKIMRSDFGKDTFAEVGCFRRMNMRNDSLILTMYDQTPDKYGYFSYYVVLYDWLGNAGPASPIAHADNLNASTQPYAAHFEATGLSDSRAVRLDWRLGNRARVNGIQVFRSRHWDGEYALVAELPTTDTTFTDEVDIANEAFFYCIGLLDVTGAVFKTPQAFAISTYNETPAPPAPVFAKGTDKGVRLTWQHSSPHIIGFQVLRADAGGLEQTDLEFQPVSDFLLRDTGVLQTFHDTTARLRGDQTYAYCVVARSDGFAFSPHSDTLLARPDKPVYIRPLRVFDPVVLADSNRVMLVWENRAEALSTLSRYRIFRKKGAEAAFDTTRYSVVNGDLNTFMDENIEPNATYFYGVCAEDMYGNVSPMSIPVQVVLNKPAPMVERLLAEPLDGGVQLRWADLGKEPGIRAFRIWRREGEAAAKMLAEVPATTASYVDRAPVANTDCYYYLTVVGDGGTESKPSPLVLMQR